MHRSTNGLIETQVFTIKHLLNCLNSNTYVIYNKLPKEVSDLSISNNLIW